VRCPGRLVSRAASGWLPGGFVRGDPQVGAGVAPGVERYGGPFSRRTRSTATLRSGNYADRTVEHAGRGSGPVLPGSGDSVLFQDIGMGCLKTSA
jgi:hypothetical protein